MLPKKRLSRQSPSELNSGSTTSGRRSDNNGNGKNAGGRILNRGNAANHDPNSCGPSCWYRFAAKLVVLIGLFFIFRWQQEILRRSENVGSGGGGGGNNKKADESGIGGSGLRKTPGAATEIVDENRSQPHDTEGSPVLFRNELERVDYNYLNKGLRGEAKHYAETMKNSSDTGEQLHIIEVGMETPWYCIGVAEAGAIAHCLEADTGALPKIYNGFENALKDDAARRNIRFYHRAAASGATGTDLSVVRGRVLTTTPEDTDSEPTPRYVDSWTNERYVPGNDRVATAKTITIDDLLVGEGAKPTKNYATTEDNDEDGYGPIGRAFLAEIDVSGYEPEVFAGMTKSIREHAIDLILFNYFPKAIDNTFHGGSDKDPSTTPRCTTEATGFLRNLVDAGYTLYTGPMHFHPKANLRNVGRTIHMHNVATDFSVFGFDPIPIRDFCEVFYDLEADNEQYRFGFWSELLAVRPGFALPHGDPPVSKVGKILTGRPTRR